MTKTQKRVKNLKKFVMAMIFAAMVFAMTACSTSEDIKEESGVEAEKTVVSIEDARGMVEDENNLFVDLRAESEYIGWPVEAERGGHIKGAMDFPNDWFSIIGNDKELRNELERRDIVPGKNIILYGSDSNSADEAFSKLVELGYENVSVLEGGANEWAKDESLPMESMPHYELLVHPQWVQDLVDGKNPDTYDGRPYKIVELSFGKDEANYEKGHIKGAIHIDDSLNHVPGSRVLADYEFIPQEEKEKFWNRPSNEKIEEILLGMGITKDTLVVIYGPNTTAASRCAAVMMYAGVEDVRILNGGIEIWNMDNMPLEEGIVKPEPAADFGAKIPARPDVLIGFDEEMKIINDENSVVASIRSWPEYICEVSGYTYIGEAGDIANSRFGYAGSDPYHMEDYRNVDNTMFNYHIMANRWNDWGIVPEKKVSFHCGTGWRASETYMYAKAMGWEDICVYDGGWYEWHLKSDTPRKEKGVPNDAPGRPIDSTGYKQ